MKTLIIIETAHLGMFFSLTYLLAIIVTAGMTLSFGFRKGYPKSTWFLILFTGLLFFIIGEKVATYTSEQWAEVFTGFRLPQTDKKTILGGIIGLFAGLILAKYLLRFNRPVLDGFAIALPLAMAISRVGCLMAGCCFGTPTNLPWGIQYDTASWVYKVHLEQGLIHLHDQASLAVHPVQMYQFIGCLVIAYIVWRTRKQWKASGTLFLFSVLCYALLRFLIEFVRDPESSFIMTQAFFGLKVIQWVIMGAILFGLLILIYRESKPLEALLNVKNHHKDAKTLNTKILFSDSSRLSALAVKEKENFVKQTYVSNLRQVFLTVLLSIFILAGRTWFDPLELSTIVLFFIPVIFTLFNRLYQRYSVAGFRWVAPVILVFSFSFMAQKSITNKNKNDKMTFTEVGITGMIGKYSEELQSVKIDYGCDGNIYRYSTIANQSVPFYQSGLNFSYNIWHGRYNKYSFGARLFYGREYPEQIPTDSESGPIFGISPYASLNWNWFGITTGFSLGQMKIPVDKPESRLDDGEIISNGKSFYKFIPSLSVRLGPADIFFAEGRYASGLFPYSAPLASFRAGVGTGFGKANGSEAAVGVCGNALYLRMVYPIKNKFVIEGFYADNFRTGDMASRIVSIGFNYRFLDTDKNKEKLKVNSMIYSTWEKTAIPVKKITDKVEDIDGNVYTTVTIGDQVWLSENLKVTHYQDGKEIPDETDNVTGSGLLYNWYAVNNSSKLCPAGWHVPSINEWRSLVSFIGDFELAADKLEDGFNVEGEASHWWSSTDQDSLQAQSLYLNTKTIGIMFTNAAKKSGLSLRCLRD